MTKRQNFSQTKITESTREETDLTSLPEKEFKTKIINMMTEMQRNIQELRDEVWREITDTRRRLQTTRRRLKKGNKLWKDL